MIIQILTSSFSCSHRSLAAIRCGDELTRRGHHVQAFVVDKCVPVQRPIFPVFDASYGYLNKHATIVTDLVALGTISQSPAARDVFFYSWDLEWLSHGGFSWKDMAPYYTTFPILARSESHARIIRNTWGANVIGIVPDFDSLDIEGVVGCLATNT
jgi:hypothetical protein